MKKLQALLFVLVFGFSSLVLAASQQYTLTIHIINKTGKTLVIKPWKFFTDTKVVKAPTHFLTNGESSDLILKREGDHSQGSIEIAVLGDSKPKFYSYLDFIWTTYLGDIGFKVHQGFYIHGKLSIRRHAKENASINLTLTS